MRKILIILSALLFSLNVANAKIILKAGILEKKSKLRSYFEKNNDLIIVPFYEDNYQTILYLTQNFFTENNEFIKTLEVNKNDILLIQNGAHELEMTEDCEFYEIKNGPYFINKDKSFIE